MRRAFVDLGASWGHISRKFSDENPEFDIYCIEANPTHIASIFRSSAKSARPFFVMCAAAWTYDGYVELFQSGSLDASTVVHGKVELGDYPPINYSAPERVQCIDFGKWLIANFSPEDELVVKLDIEGAEYPILQKMLEDGSLRLINRLICEWHQDRFPDITAETHAALREAVKSQVGTLEEWV